MCYGKALINDEFSDNYISFAPSPSPLLVLMKKKNYLSVDSENRFSFISNKLIYN